MARYRDASSIGWCVGPSSPVPILSCVATCITWSSCRAAIKLVWIVAESQNEAQELRS
jgi:hypothetical protein